MKVSDSTSEGLKDTYLRTTKLQGDPGMLGMQGRPGVVGPTGMDGEPGQNGTMGDKGVKGLPGPTGRFLISITSPLFCFEAVGF